MVYKNISCIAKSESCFLHSMIFCFDRREQTPMLAPDQPVSQAARSIARIDQGKLKLSVSQSGTGIHMEIWNVL